MRSTKDKSVKLLRKTTSWKNKRIIPRNKGDNGHALNNTGVLKGIKRTKKK